MTITKSSEIIVAGTVRKNLKIDHGRNKFNGVVSIS